MADCNKDTIIKKSRKARNCEHCGLKIPKGTSYVRSSGIFDNDPYSVAQHHECLEAYVEFNKGEDHHRWFPLYESENFKEHQEMIKGIYRGNLEKL